MTDKNCTFTKGEGVQMSRSGDVHSHARIHDHSHDGAEHGHTHDIMEHPGIYHEREQPMGRGNYDDRAFTVGVGGPVGSGKTALLLALCKALGSKYNMACLTNDIFTKEDGEFLLRNNALPAKRIRMVETGGCPHAAIREDVSANKLVVENLTDEFGCDFVLLESGGDNLAANFSRELADYIIYVIDVAGGDKVPRKGGPGITQSDLLVINKTDLAEAVGADLNVMDRDAKRMRGSGPTEFTQCKHNVGIDNVCNLILTAWSQQTGKKIHD
eukprot:CFRG6878T1